MNEYEIDSYGKGAQTTEEILNSYGIEVKGVTVVSCSSDSDEVLIPEGFYDIGAGAFAGSTVKRVALPEGIVRICERAFMNSKIEEIVLPSTLQTIGERAFYNCKSLSKISLPASLSELGEEAFYGCEAIKEITVPPLETIPKRAFLGSSYGGKIILSEGTSIIDESAFSSISPKYIYIPKSVHTVRKCAFASFGKSDEIDSIVEYGGNKNEWSKITWISEKRTYTRKELVYSSEYKNFIHQDVSFTSEDKHLIYPTITDENREEMHKRLKEKEENGSFEIEDGVLTGYDSYLDGDIVIPEGVVGIGELLFCGNTKIKSITFPSTLTYIGKSAFEDCTGLERVTFNEGLESIGSEAFQKCTSLLEITLPSTLKWMKDSRSFCGCSSLKSADLSKTKLINIPTESFCDCTSLASVQLPETLSMIDERAFAWSGLEKIVIPRGVTEIGERAFTGNSSLESVILPDTLVTIGDRAFAKTGLVNIDIPDGVQKIHECAFSFCYGLSEVKIPDCVIEMGYDVFWGCPNDIEITVSGSAESISGWDKLWSRSETKKLPFGIKKTVHFKNIKFEL